jgi:hypothetical protein
MAQLGERVDLVLDGGPARGGVPSTVVDCSGEEPLILRAGEIGAAAIADALAAEPRPVSDRADGPAIRTHLIDGINEPE